MSCKYIITRYYNYSTAVFLSFFLQDFNKDVVHYNYNNNNNNTNSKYSESSCTEDFYKWPLPVWRWRLVIHGGIDRYSCLVVYLECSEEQQRWDQREFVSSCYWRIPLAFQSKNRQGWRKCCGCWLDDRKELYLHCK